MVPNLSWNDSRLEKERFEKDLKAIPFYSIILKSQSKKLMNRLSATP